MQTDYRCNKIRGLKLSDLTKALENLGYEKTGCRGSHMKYEINDYKQLQRLQEKFPDKFYSKPQTLIIPKHYEIDIGIFKEISKSVGIDKHLLYFFCSERKNLEKLIN